GRRGSREGGVSAGVRLRRCPRGHRRVPRQAHAGLQRLLSALAVSRAAVGSTFHGVTEESQPTSLRDRFGARGEEALGRIAQDLLENPWVNSALSAALE